MPKPSEATKDFFASVVPDAPAVTTRPMFGQLSAFVNGNMFMGIFGEPMSGRPMKEYVVLPPSWRDEPDRVREWAARSLDHAEELPPKKPKKKK